MSKELIEQLAKEHGAIVHGDGNIFFTNHVKLEAFAKAYQAAAPIDNVLAEALGKAAQVCDEEAKDLRTFSEPFGANVAEACAEKIRALIPTQANRTEG
jgi:hypothetical protein